MKDIVVTIRTHIFKVKLSFYPPCEVKYKLQNEVSTLDKFLLLREVIILSFFFYLIFFLVIKSKYFRFFLGIKTAYG